MSKFVKNNDGFPAHAKHARASVASSRNAEVLKSIDVDDNEFEEPQNRAKHARANADTLGRNNSTAADNQHRSNPAAESKPIEKRKTTTQKTPRDKATLFTIVLLALSLPIIQINAGAFAEIPEKIKDYGIERISKEKLLGTSNLLKVDLNAKTADAVTSTATSKSIDSKSEEDTEKEETKTEEANKQEQNKKTTASETSSSNDSTSGSSQSDTTPSQKTGHYETVMVTPERVVKEVQGLVCMCGASFPNVDAWQAHRPNP